MKDLATENARRAGLRVHSMALVRDRAKGKMMRRGEACHETATASHYSRRQSRSLCEHESRRVNESVASGSEGQNTNDE
jgi:hypothetical protein